MQILQEKAIKDIAKNFGISEEEIIKQSLKIFLEMNLK